MIADGGMSACFVKHMGIAQLKGKTSAIGTARLRPFRSSPHTLRKSTSGESLTTGTLRSLTVRFNTWLMGNCSGIFLKTPIRRELQGMQTIGRWLKAFLKWMSLLKSLLKPALQGLSRRKSDTCLRLKTLGTTMTNRHCK